MRETILSIDSVTLETLKAERRWVLWRYEQRPTEKKPTKVPYQLNGRRAANDNPATFSTFAECERALDSFDGIGMELGCWPEAPTPIVGVDGDECVNAEGKFSPESREVVIALNSYSEFSPSKSGVHVWCLAELGGRKGVQRPFPGFKQIEIKGNGFYHTFTGRHLSKTPKNIMSRQAEIDALYLKVTRGTGIKLQAPPDETEKFNKLFAGDMSDYGNDHSRADLALCCILARRCGNNIFEIDRQFRESALFRDKWNEREDYVSGTILKAVAANQVALEPMALDDEDMPAEWIVEPLPGREEGWFPTGEVSLMGGPSGGGKTHSLLRIVENMRHGQKAFGHECHPREYGILLHDRSLSAMRRTCVAGRVNPDEVMSRVIRLTPEQQKARPAAIVESAILSRPHVKLWILEGLDFWTPDIHKLEAVGAVLDELQRVSRNHRVAVVGTLGSPKQKEHDRYAAGRDQFMGSVAFGRKSETCINLNTTSDDNVREMSVYNRNTANERYWFTWDAHAGVVETKQPVPVETGDTERTDAIDLMEMRVFGKFKPGEQIKYEKSLGPYATYFRWRRVAEAACKVVKTGKKWYRTHVDSGVGIGESEDAA